MAYPTGEAKLEPLRVNFDRRLKLEFHGSRFTSDAGLVPYRDLDDALGLTELGGAVLSETRRGKNIRHLLIGLLRQSVFGRLAGYEDVNNADRLSHDPSCGSSWIVRALIGQRPRPVSPELSCRLIMLKNFGYRAMLLPYEPCTFFRDQFPDGRLPLPAFPTA